MAFFSGLFGSFSGLCPATRRKGEPPYHGKERLRRKPISTPRHQGQLSSGRANPHSKKEWGPLTARKKGKKEGPTHHLEKEGPNARANPFREGKKNLHSEGQIQEGPNHHSKKAWRTSSTAKKGQFPRARPVPRRKGKPPLPKGRANSRTKKEEATTTVRNTGKGHPKTREGEGHPRKPKPQPREGRSQEGRVKIHTPRKEGPTPTPKRQDQFPPEEGQPREGRGNPPPRGGMANPSHSKKSQPQEGRAKHNLKKDGQPPHPEKAGNPEGKANPNKEGSTI